MHCIHDVPLLCLVVVVVLAWGNVFLPELGILADLLQRVFLQDGAVLKHGHQQVLRGNARKRPWALH